jgi:hypothetical protein
MMMGADTKKDAHTVVEIPYNKSRHEPTPRGEGLARVAGQSCLASPSVALAAPVRWAQPWLRVWYVSHTRRVKLFVRLQAFFEAHGRGTSWLRRHLSPAAAAALRWHESCWNT